MMRCALALSATLGLWAAGCACTEVGCADGFAVTVTVDATMVPAGTHTLNVTADGTPVSCTFTFPPPGARFGTIVSANCPKGLSLSFALAQTCMIVQTGTGSANECQAVAGEFEEYVLLPGTPSSVRLQQSADGNVLLDQTLTPTYKIDQPNGASCGPTCYEASAELTIP
jgi:hypothetical protein